MHHTYDSRLSPTPASHVTFKGWIAMLHPENVTLDHRLDLPENNWLGSLALWNEAHAAHEPTCDAGVGDSRESYV